MYQAKKCEGVFLYNRDKKIMTYRIKNGRKYFLLEYQRERTKYHAA